jgi:hypothetical protein
LTKTAISLAQDPNRPVAVYQATAVRMHLTMTVRTDPRYDLSTVVAGVHSALLDPHTGLLGPSLRIGQTIYKSQIYKARSIKLAIPGAVAVHGLSFVVIERIMPLLRTAFRVRSEIFRFSPHPGFSSDTYFDLTEDNLVIVPEAAENGQ